MSSKNSHTCKYAFETNNSMGLDVTFTLGTDIRVSGTVLLGGIAPRRLLNLVDLVGPVDCHPPCPHDPLEVRARQGRDLIPFDHTVFVLVESFQGLAKARLGSQVLAKQQAANNGDEAHK